MKVDVHVVDGPEVGVSFSLEKNTRRTIGRGDEAAIQLCEDELLSRIHLSIEFDGLTLHVTDLGSTNGTFLDGRPLPPNTPVPVQDGQSFIAGRVSKFVVKFVGEKADVQPNRPTTPDLLGPPPEEPGSNFGSSFFTSQPAPGSPSSSGAMPEGNFSQSIRQDFSDRNPLLGNLTSSDSQLFGQGGQRSAPPPPATTPDPIASPPPPSSVGGHGYGSDIGSSIAHPGMQGISDADSADYRDNDVIPADARAERPGRTEIELPSAPKPPSAYEELSDAEMKTPSIYSPGGSVEQSHPTPPVPEPTNTDTTPQPAAPPAAASPFESIGYAGQSIASPAGDAASPPPAPSAPATESVSPFSGSVSIPQGSIGLPGQVHPQEVPRRRKTDLPTDAAPLVQKTSFHLGRHENGLFFHVGADLADLAALQAALQKKFETLFCVHLSRADIDLAAAPAEPPAAADDNPTTKMDSDSPFADDSPFDDEVGADSVAAPDAAPENSAAESAPPIGDPLFHWFPKEVRWGGPVLLKPAEMPCLLSELWEQDAVVTCFGGSFDQMADQLKSIVRTDVRTGKASESIFGVCWPSVLHSIVTTQSQQRVSRIFESAGISGVLIEDPTGESAWQLIGPVDLSELLLAVGFART